MLTFIYCFQISPVAGSHGQISKYGGGGGEGVGGHSVHRLPESKGAASEPAGRVGACPSPHEEGFRLFLLPCHPHPPCPMVLPQIPATGLPCASSLTPCSSEHPWPGLTRPCASLCTPAARPAILLQLFGGRSCSQRNTGTFSLRGTSLYTRTVPRYASPWLGPGAQICFSFCEAVLG